MTMQGGWTTVETNYIETLKDAVLGAGLEATQISKGRLSGSLTFAEYDGVTFSSGSVGGKISLIGTLSEESLTLGAGLRLASGCRHWGREFSSGHIGIFHAGDEHDAIYQSGSLYLGATVPLQQLCELAERQNLVVNRATIGNTGVHRRVLDEKVTRYMASYLDQVHAGETAFSSAFYHVFMQTMLQYYGSPTI
ncbi:MAG: hypothetical protein VXW22_12535 [Pseudomonadota bacterium]|nr:hypothetical protein [Pseudomonadota bacterium]